MKKNTKMQSQLMKILSSLLVLAHGAYQVLNKNGDVMVDISQDPKDKILATFYHYSRPSLIVLTANAIVEYSLASDYWVDDTEFEKIGEKKVFKHNIANLENTFKLAKMDKSGELFIFCDKILVLDDMEGFRVAHNYTLSMLNNLSPDSFNISEFGEYITFHQYDYK